MKYRVPIIGSGASPSDSRRPAHQNLLGPIWTRRKEFETATHCVVEVHTGMPHRTPCEAPGHSVLSDMPDVEVLG